IGAVQRPALAHPRMIGRQLGAEVQAFLDVGPAGGQLAADREEAAPGPAAPGHGDLHLGLARQGAERSEEHTYDLPSLMRPSYAVFSLTPTKNRNRNTYN